MGVGERRTWWTYDDDICASYTTIQCLDNQNKIEGGWPFLLWLAAVDIFTWRKMNSIQALSVYLGCEGVARAEYSRTGTEELQYACAPSFPLPRLSAFCMVGMLNVESSIFSMVLVQWWQASICTARDLLAELRWWYTSVCAVGDILVENAWLMFGEDTMPSLRYIKTVLR